jgi:hypothetical protein
LLKANVLKKKWDGGQNRSLFSFQRARKIAALSELLFNSDFYNIPHFQLPWQVLFFANRFSAVLKAADQAAKINLS